jgi:membrane protease YdiL (CAAX protease family)
MNPDYEGARLNLVHNLYRIEDYEAAAGELSKLYPGAKDKASFVLSTLRHLLFPFLILSLLLFLSRNRRISPYFCNSGQGAEDIFKTLMVVMSIFALSLLAAPLFHNPFARNYGEKVVITFVLDTSLLKEEPGRYFLADVLSNLFIPAYYMNKCGISIAPLFAVDWSMLKRTGKYLLAGFFLFIALAVPLSLTLTLTFPAELEAHDQIIKALNESIQTYSLFGKTRLGLLGPFMEEFYFRGMVFLLLRRRFKVLWSIIFSALLFAAAHYNYGVISLLGVFTFGIVAAYLLHKTRSLWPPFIFHAVYNSLRFLT